MPRTRRAENITLIARRISTSLQSVGEDFAALGRLIEAGMASRTAGPRTRLVKAAPARRRARRMLTDKDRARLKLQGEYLGLVRHLSIRDRNRVKMLRAKKGYLPAIKFARRLVKTRG